MSNRVVRNLPTLRATQYLHIQKRTILKNAGQPSVNLNQTARRDNRQTVFFAEDASIPNSPNAWTSRVVNCNKYRTVHGLQKKVSKVRDLRFFRRWKFRWRSSGMWHYEVPYTGINVSDKPIAIFLRVVSSRTKMEVVTSSAKLVPTHIIACYHTPIILWH